MPKTKVYALEDSLGVDKKSIETMFSIPICRPTGDKWQSKTLFLSILIRVRRLLITFSIAVYQVWFLFFFHLIVLNFCVLILKIYIFCFYHLLFIFASCKNASYHSTVHTISSIARGCRTTTTTWSPCSRLGPTTSKHNWRVYSGSCRNGNSGRGRPGGGWRCDPAACFTTTVESLVIRVGGA